VGMPRTDAARGMAGMPGPGHCAVGVGSG